MKSHLRRILQYIIAKFYRKFISSAEAYEWQKLKLEFISIGEGSYIPTPRRICNPKYISIGKNFSALYNFRIEAIDNYCGLNYYPKIIIGDNVSINTDCHIGCIDKIEIGSNVLIASRVYISDHSHGEINSDSLLIAPALRPLFSKGPVIIEDNVWIGEGVCILSGVTIGKNSVIGANAVVTKNIPESSVAVGVPASIIKIFK